MAVATSLDPCLAFVNTSAMETPIQLEKERYKILQHRKRFLKLKWKQKPNYKQKRKICGMPFDEKVTEATSKTHSFL